MKAKLVDAINWLYGLLLSPAFNRHWQRAHNADFEVCGDPLCWLAYQFERAVFAVPLAGVVWWRR